VTRLFNLYRFKFNFISSIFILISFAILSKLFFIQTFQSSDLRQKTLEAGYVEIPKKGSRGKILDRNGQILAETVKTYTFYANTEKDSDINAIVELFSNIFNKDKQHYNKLLSKNKSYIPLSKPLKIAECEKILEKLEDIKGLFCNIELTRYYPFHNLASQVVGYVDRDQKGQFGIEKQFDPILTGKTNNFRFNRSPSGRLTKSVYGNDHKLENGADIQITMDANLQTILLDALTQGLKRSGAENANGIIINPFTGDILAMASIPDYDPNTYWNYDVSNFLNKTISISYEPGSTFKLIPLAAALESGAFNENEKIFCENGEYQIHPSRKIHDHEPHGELLISEIFIYSSNIGLAKMVETMGSRTIYNYARKFGFGTKTGIALPSEASGLLRSYNKWNKLSGPFVSIGQEISINTLQLAIAYSSIANGGYLPSARIVKHISGNGFEDRDYSPKPIRRVVSNETAMALKLIMENVVNKGTASKARIPGFRIGGKTGTAEKFIDGKYSKDKFISSFAAIFPIDDPKYVCIVSVDSPDYYSGKHWGNETAAPIVKDVFERIIINKEEFIPKTNNKEQMIAGNMIQSNKTTLSTKNILKKTTNAYPNFLGKTLKQTILEAKDLGIIINPVGTSGRVVWQSISPGKSIQDFSACTIKLESL